MQNLAFLCELFIVCIHMVRKQPACSKCCASIPRIFSWHFANAQELTLLWARASKRRPDRYDMSFTLTFIQQLGWPLNPSPIRSADLASNPDCHGSGHGGEVCRCHSDPHSMDARTFPPWVDKAHKQTN